MKPKRTAPRRQPGRGKNFEHDSNGNFTPSVRQAQLHLEAKRLEQQTRRFLSETLEGGSSVTITCAWNLFQAAVKTEKALLQEIRKDSRKGRVVVPFRRG